MTPTTPLTVAVVTGGHSFDVPNFHRFFRALAGFDCYIQHMEDFAAAPQATRDAYHVILFYIMLQDGPSDEGRPGYAGKPYSALSRLGQTKQGIFVMHHALLAYPEWSAWQEMVGLGDWRPGFKYFHDERVPVKVVDPAHPITQGMSDWEMIDETYEMGDTDQDSHILLSTDHPHSMQHLGWTRQYGQSRVFCLQSGHDNQTWQNDPFRRVVERGLLWCAGRI